MRSWVLFDFDGTLTARDTTRDLIVALLRQRPWRALFVVGLVIARMSRSSMCLQRAKERCIGRLIAGLDDASMSCALAHYRAAVLPLLRPPVVQAMDDALQRGPVAIVSASPEFALAAVFSMRAGLHLVGTRYRKRQGVFQAELDGAPCYGESKVEAVQRLVARTGQPVSIEAAWSDAASDLPMMRLAAVRHWVGATAELVRLRALDPDGRFHDAAALSGLAAPCGTGV